MTRAANILVQLAGDAVPLFADSQREYFYVTRVEGHRRIEGGVRLSVFDNDDKELVLDLRFVTPEILRVRLYQPGEEPPLTSPMLVDRPQGAPDVSVQSTAEKVILTTSALQLKVVRKPFHFGVFDRRGRKVFVQQIGDVSLAHPIAFPLGYSRDAEGRMAFHESFELTPDEHFFGLGEQYGQFDKRAQRVISWSRETMLTNTINLTYHNTPFFQSSRGYGVFVHHSSKIIYELGFPSTISGSFRVNDPYLDYFFIYGPGPKQILARYADLTGHAPVPPLWSFGVWFSRCSYFSRAEVEEVVTKAREMAIPMDVLHIDGWMGMPADRPPDGTNFEWGYKEFGDPESLIRWLAERGVKLTLWENPYVPRLTEMFQEGKEKGYFAIGPDGEPAPSLENAVPGGNLVVDFTNPDARRWWQDKHRRWLRLGVAAFKTDFGEGVPADARFFDGRGGAEVHNIYPMLYNRAVFEVVKEERGEGLVWGRSGYAGSQRSPVNWMGDSQPSFGGMTGALRAGLSIGMSGIPFWGHDIGGFASINLDSGAKSFFDPRLFRLPDPTLYIRWAQWGLLSSHSRFHGILPREPWAYGDDAVRIVRDFARLRYRLLPYLWACAHEASRSLIPVVRPMYLEFHDDPLTPALQHQYMLGPSLLVVPVTNEEGRCRPYLPAGRWYDFWSSTVLEGPCHLDLRVPLDRIPVYVRENSIIPYGPDMEYVGQRKWDKLRLDVWVSGKAAVRVPAPVGVVEARAQRTGNSLLLDLRASGQRLEVHLLDPAVVKEVKFSGACERMRWRQARRGAVIELTVKGRAVVEAKV